MDRDELGTPGAHHCEWMQTCPPCTAAAVCCENRGEDGGLNISLILVFTVLMGCLAPASLLFLDVNSLAAAGQTEEHVPQQLFSNPETFTWH